MFKLLERIREVIKRMFDKSTLEKVTGDSVTLSKDYITALEDWQKMIKGQASWVENDEDGVKSLGIENQICKEFADVSLSEMETRLDNENLDPLYQKAVKGLNEAMQTGLALGSFVVKPIGDTGEFEFINADRIIPLEFNADGKLTRVAFVQVKPVGDTDVYYRLEIHELTSEGLHIVNRAYKGTKGDFGNEIRLETVEEWAELLPEVTYSGMDRMDFGYYRNPIPNYIDGSNSGVSIFHNAKEMIRKADIQFSRIDWEYSSGERLVFGDYQVFQKTGTGNGFRWKAPKGKERMFVGVDLTQGDNDVWQEHSPTLRDASFISGLNEYKREIEFAVSLTYGDLSKNETVEKTASEIEFSKNRKYNRVNAIQKNLRDCLEDLAYAIAFYQAQFTRDIGFVCTFHDSIKTDEETERAQDRIDVSMGVMSKEEYRMKWYSEDEETAREKLALALAEAMALAGGGEVLN